MNLLSFVISILLIPSFIGGRAACVISWSAKQGTGQPSYSSVIDSLSDLNQR